MLYRTFGSIVAVLALGPILAVTPARAHPRSRPESDQARAREQRMENGYILGESVSTHEQISLPAG